MYACKCVRVPKCIYLLLDEWASKYAYSYICTYIIKCACVYDWDGVCLSR